MDFLLIILIGRLNDYWSKRWIGNGPFSTLNSIHSLTIGTANCKSNKQTMMPHGKTAVCPMNVYKCNILGRLVVVTTHSSWARNNATGKCGGREVVWPNGGPMS